MEKTAWLEVTKEVRSGGGERGVKCNVLILSGLDKRGVSKTDTPLLCNRLYFNILHFTLGRGAGTTAAAAAGFAGGRGEMAAERWVTKEVRNGGGKALGDEGSAERGNWFFRPRPEK